MLRRQIEKETKKAHKNHIIVSYLKNCSRNSFKSAAVLFSDYVKVVEMRKTVHFEVGGMACISCQEKIEKALRGTKGVLKVRVSYSKGTADIDYDDEKADEKRLKKVIEKEGYKVLSPENEKEPDILKAVGFLAIIGACFYLLQSFGILNYLAPDKLAESGMGYGMLFVIGLATSFHCVAMCGGIGLSQSFGAKEKVSFRGPIAYNLGRVCSYTLIGLVLGTIGAVMGDGMSLGIPFWLQGGFKILVGLLMLAMGINMLGIFPWLRRFSLHMPMAIGKLIGGKRQEGRAPFIIGLLNGLMPCGPLQAMWIVALATANPVSGALSMLVFSLGTVPLMLGLGSAVSLLGKKFTSQVMKVGAIIVAVMGLAMLSQGVTLSGIAPIENVLSRASEEEVSDNGADFDSNELEPTESTSDVQIVNSTLTLGRYPDITVKSGVPVKWTIDVPENSLTGCNAVMVIPDYGIQYAFTPGENIVEFTPQKAGTVRYSCWMGMVTGSIEVTD